MEYIEYVCPNCGKDKIEYEAWVNGNYEVIRMGDDIYCSECNDWISEVVEKSKYKQQEEEHDETT